MNRAAFTVWRFGRACIVAIAFVLILVLAAVAAVEIPERIPGFAGQLLGGIAAALIGGVGFGIILIKFPQKL